MTKNPAGNPFDDRLIPSVRLRKNISLADALHQRIDMGFAARFTADPVRGKPRRSGRGRIARTA